MYRITIYEEGKDPDKNEFIDIEEVEDAVEDCMTDLKAGVIKGFTVSRIKNPWGKSESGDSGENH